MCPSEYLSFTVCEYDEAENIFSRTKKTVEIFGGIDILVNNASAISLTSTEQTEPKRFDLMMDIEISFRRWGHT